MYINNFNLSKNMDAILDETPIEKMIKLAYGKQIDEETETKIAHSIYISIIVQNFYKKLKPYWGTIYKDSFDAEKDLRTEDSKNEKAKIEVDFKTGIEEFLLYFDELSCSNLTYYIKKKFRRYRFKEINRVNDYTILYFTYRLYEIYCNECLDDVDADEIAENFSKMAYNRLNKRGKKQATVTCDNLTAFVRQFDLISPNYTYLHIFINYIQDVYYSDMEDVWIYAIFSRLSTHLLLINIYLHIWDIVANGSSKSKKVIEYHNYKKISKYVSNQKRNLSNEDDENAETIKELLDNLQSEFRKFPKSSDDLKKLTNSKYHQACNRIYECVKKLNEYKNTKWADTISNTITAYCQLPFENDGNIINIYDIVMGGLSDEGHQATTKCLKNIKFSKNYFNGNIFLQLLFSTMALTDKELDEFNKISDEVIEYIDNKVESLLYGVKFEMNAYKKIIEPVELDIFNPCILNIDLFQNQRYIDMIEYLENILF